MSKPISSSDPQALDKLKVKQEGLESMHTRMKTVNAYYRKHGTCKGCEGISDDQAAKMDQEAERYGQPYVSYMLSYNNKDIKTVKDRIKELEYKQEVGYVGWEFEGGNAEANLEDNRLQLFFDEKPNEDLRRQLKTNGFKWAPSVGAWQRMLNDNAIYAAGRVDALKPLSGESVRAIQPKAPAKDQQER